MTKPKFTPGPWHAEHTFDPARDDSYVRDSRNMIVADVYATIPGNSDEDGYSGSQLQEFDANKRLVAASPELYEMVLRLTDGECDYCDRLSDTKRCNDCVFFVAKQLIARINGNY